MVARVGGASEAVESFRVVFENFSDQVTVEDGWYIDDLEITAEEAP